MGKKHNTQKRGPGGKQAGGNRMDGSGRSPAGAGRAAGDARVESADKCRTPYHFVPVAPDLALLDEPVFHDVQQTGDEFWSGELHCTLTALTPLIAGNYQFDYEHCQTEVTEAFERLLRERRVQRQAVDNQKKVIEPMSLGTTSDGLPERVLIPGEAIKGCIVQSLKALLSAPMERVQERTFSYRVNLQTLTPKHHPLSQTIPALVVGGGGWGAKEQPNAVKLILLKDLRDVCYVHPDALRFLPTRITSLTDDPSYCQHYADPVKRKALALCDDEMTSMDACLGLSQGNILKPGAPRPCSELLGWLPVRNLNGFDLTATFNRRFHEKSPQDVDDTKSAGGYPFLFIKLPNSPKPQELAGDALEAFYRSLQHLADADEGHLRDHPLLENRGEVKAVTEGLRKFLERGLRPGDVVFLEMHQVGDNERTVATVGHHFYYRQRYRDSIHQAGPLRRDGQPISARERLRPVLCPADLEQKTQPHGIHAGAPRRLTTGRGLFGYVAQNRDAYEEPDEPLTFGIGANDTDFKQLAGRISVNWAVESGAADRPHRFLNPQYSCLVPLRPLGSPKPSAVETYLRQDQERLKKRSVRDQGTLCTYGDTPEDDSAGDLNGRKFYLHQPDAAARPDCYELTSEANADWFLGEGANRKLAILSNQAGIARFVSLPGTQFRVAIRLRDLRLWEFGALWFVLAPDEKLVRLLVDSLQPEKVKRFEKWLSNIAGWAPDDARHPLLAHKLGHARPLGLGSITFRIDNCQRLRFNADMTPPTLESVAESDAVERLRCQAVAAFARKLKESLSSESSQSNIKRWVESIFTRWLQVHRYAGRRRLDYPRGSRGTSTTGLIYEYHSEQRRKHARGRKLPPAPSDSPQPGGLMSLDELDRQ